MTITRADFRPLNDSLEIVDQISPKTVNQPMTAAASVVIVEYKAAGQLEAFLRHMDTQGLHDLEYVIYRNSCDETAEPIKTPARLDVLELRDRRNLGFGAAFNRAAAHCTTEVILSCNSDILPSVSVVRSMISRAKERRELVAPVLFNDDGEERGRPFYSPLSMVKARIPSMRESVVTGRADWVIGACFAIAREYFQELGGFHRAYKLYVEDVDLCWRVRSSGGSVHVLEDTRVFHAHGRASRKVLSKPFAYHVRGGVAFFLLHPAAIVGGGPRPKQAASGPSSIVA